MKNRLDKELPRRGLVRSRNSAQEKINSGAVSVNGKVITKTNLLVDAADLIKLEKGSSDFVGRGGKKLEGAIHALAIDFKNKIVIDVGSSTGGFTDAVLLNGAKKVYAVDVGTDQLDRKLRNDTRVVVMEKTDIRKIQLEEKADIAVIDVSFISLEKILKPVKELLAENGIVIALVKPQFEVGKETAKKYKGIITSDSERKKSLVKVLNHAESIGYSIMDTIESPIAGSDGNIEYFAYLRKK